MPAKWHQDAELTDLFFSDQQNGWVVGDRGLVLKTTSGGKSWEPVKLSWDPFDPEAPQVTCRLETVVFASATHGWIAGGYSNPQATTSTGVLFATTDGGNSWKRMQGATLPKINQLIFANPLEGIAIGDGNALKPAGVFHTRDGGRSWSAATEGAIESWQTGSHANGVTTLAGSNGSLATYSNHKITTAFIGDTQPARIRQMKMMDERFGFAVGEAANFLQTRNGGLSWHPDQNQPGLLENEVDFQTLAIHKERIWVAGNPGTYIYLRESPQASWQRFPTSIQAPLTRLRFVDEAFGWAISCCGDIIHTENGGRQWTIQRRGTRGVALLQVGESANELIPELFCKFCCDEDYIGACLLLKTRPTPAGETSVDVLRQAMSRVGGSFTNERRFVDPDHDTRRISAQIQEYLVRQIRALRPRIIAIPSGRVMNEPLSVRASILNAVRLAADPQQFRSQIDDFGLRPWQVGKVIVMDRGDVASLQISSAHYMMSFGALVSDHAAASRMLLNQSVLENRTLSLTTIFTSPYAAGPDNSLFGALENTDAAIPVRKGRHHASGNMIQMRQLASKRKTLDRLLEWSAHVPSPAIWSNSLAELTLQLDKAAAGVWLFELANRCNSLGEIELAVETHLYITSHYRQHPLSVASFRWLYNYYASAEQAHLTIRRTEINSASPIETEIAEGAIQSRPIKRIVDGVEVLTWEVEDPRTTGQAIQPTTLTTEQKSNTFRRRYQQARAISQSFALVDPTAIDTGRYRLAKIGLNQKIDPLISVETQLKRLAIYNQSPVADAALLELGIFNRRHDADPVPREIVCHATTVRPWLDGQLDDEAWTNALANRAMIPLQSIHSVESTDEMLIAADDEFLYIALRCQQSADLTYESNATPRSRDRQLMNGDRVEIAIDIDRDYESFFLFSVDSAGRVADSFGSNLAWDPAWYVATRLSEKHWFAEIAIPLDEISRHGDFWSIAANRHIRNRLISSCWQPASDQQADPANAPKITAFESLHRAVNQQQTALPLLPVQAFRLVRMPWATKHRATTTNLPADQ